MSNCNEIKYPIGNDVFVSAAIYRGEVKVHIRRYKAIQSAANTTIVVPTRYGVCLTDKQVISLINQLPYVLTEMQSLQTDACERTSSKRPASTECDKSEISKRQSRATEFECFAEDQPKM